jgi:hypothetical protein
MTSRIEWFGGQRTAGLATGSLRVGDSVSLTMTSKLLLAPDVDVTVTVVVPTGKNDPEAGLLVSTPQLPVELGAG